jgi:carbonic anhydrase/acetyltransferase-like protein (isoleucine patch superfamily)
MIRAFKNHYPALDETVFVDETAVVIGQVVLGPHSSVFPMSVLRGDVNTITIGAYTNIQDGVVIHVNHAGPFNGAGDPVVIGDYVTIGHQAMLHGCTLCGHNLIGAGAQVMDGAVIEEGAWVAAGSLVTPGTVVKSGMIWMGRPAQRYRALTAKEQEKTHYSAQYYAQLAKAHAQPSAQAD